ncbi:MULTISPECIES: hypothetical protein [unclassified Endozoicomonas]|uniref:hypothetical protein n=1 Tax=unclassified Endozoicomonas TaxID=2644528 RepID=UPI003BB48E22
MNNVDKNSGIVGLFSQKPKEEIPKGVSFGRTTMAADKVDSSLSHVVNGSGTDHSSQRLETIASTSTSLGQRVVSNQTNTEIDAAKTKAQENVSAIIDHLDGMKERLIAKDKYCRNTAHNPDIQVFENVIQLLGHLEPGNISEFAECCDSTCFVKFGDHSFCTTDFNFYYGSEVLFSLHHNVFMPCGKGYSLKKGAEVIETSALFDELYFAPGAPGAPGYQAAKSDFERLQSS